MCYSFEDSCDSFADKSNLIGDICISSTVTHLKVFVYHLKMCNSFEDVKIICWNQMLKSDVEIILAMHLKISEIHFNMSVIQLQIAISFKHICSSFKDMCNSFQNMHILFEDI